MILKIFIRILFDLFEICLKTPKETKSSQLSGWCEVHFQ